MIPDMNDMSVVEVERFIISNLDRIKNLGRGMVTVPSIAKTMGIHENKDQVKKLRTKIKSMKCLERRGNHYIVKVEEIKEHDGNAFDIDPDLSLMREIFTGNFKRSPQRDVVIRYTDDAREYKCKNCIYFDVEKKECAESGEPRNACDVQCKNGTFRLDMKSLGANEHSWYKKKLDG